MALFLSMGEKLADFGYCFSRWREKLMDVFRTRSREREREHSTSYAFRIPNYMSLHIVNFTWEDRCLHSTHPAPSINRNALQRSQGLNFKVSGVFYMISAVGKLLLCRLYSKYTTTKHSRFFFLGYSM